MVLPAPYAVDTVSILSGAFKASFAAEVEVEVEGTVVLMMVVKRTAVPPPVFCGDASRRAGGSCFC